jgi:hypothetical protein
MTDDPRRIRPFPNLSLSDFSSLDEAEASMREFDERWGHLQPDADDDIEYYVDRMCDRWVELMASGDEDGARSVSDVIDATLLSNYPWRANAPEPRRASDDDEVTPS